MRIKLFLLTFLAVVVLGGPAFGQKASQGKAVVSKGFEHSDSIRFGMLRPMDVSQWGGSTLVTQVNAQIDSMECSAEEDFDLPISVANSTLYGHRKVMCAPGSLDGASGPDLVIFGHTILQRIYPPFAIVGPGDDDQFRYNDLYLNPQVTIHNVTYDSNDISPYVEYPAKDSIVRATFDTRRYHNIDSTVYYGNEGRVILGYSDDRNASHLLSTATGYPFPSRPGLFDTAKAFSVNLEFWLDTTASNIDMTKANTANADSVPLVRLQVLFKPSGQSILPFVPFTNGSDTNHGWFQCLDTVITRSIYKNLDTDWRAPDSVFTATAGTNAYSWKFRQFHTMIDFSHVMDSIWQNRIASATIGSQFPFGYSRFMDNYGVPAGGAVANTYWHPDSLVFYSTVSGDKFSPLIEIRLLSTYRTTVRVRDITYQDTMADRYLYRRRIGDSTHSLEQNRSLGGNDSLLNSALASWNSLLGSNVPRELMYNDIGLPAAGAPAMGVLEGLGTKYNIYVHMRPQDNGDWSLAWRKARMSMDGQPPSIFENQENGYGALWMPLDYVYYGLKSEQDSLWGRSHFDTSMGQTIVRPKDTVAGRTDTLVGYNIFSNRTACYSLTFRGIRAMSRVGQWHPFSKRFATEYSIKSFSYVNNGAYDTNVARHSTGSHGQDTIIYLDSIIYRGHYDSLLGQWVIPRTFVSDGKTYGTGYFNLPLTPEMITTLTYGAFASGATAVSAGEAFGNDGDDHGTHDMGVFSPAERSSSDSLGLADYTHDYNVGHYYTCRQWTFNGSYGSDMDGPLPNYYLGMSNSYRAYAQSIGRINAIWSTGDHPVKNLRWLDSYNQFDTWNPWNRITRPPLQEDQGDSRPIGPDDSIAASNAFLKVLKTQAVDSWNRNASGSYIDKDTDADTMTQALVGMFIDSINTATKNYAALVINPRCWPCRDSATLAYYNNGLDSISKIHPTLGDIDVRKVYLKLDLSKTDPMFSNHIYYVVRDLWHPDSTWLLNKDSTFAVYIKPGDAKFLYFEPGIAVNVAARSGTDSGTTTAPEFCFNNGRRVAEIENHTHDVVCYTRNHHLYVAYPAAGNTFGNSPDQSSGDNIITGYEQALDTTHTCARPSIAVAMNDTGVALAYWYKDGSGNGHIGAAYRKAPGSAWQIITLDPSGVYPDASGDNSMVTPVITPCNDTSWLVAAGLHPPGGLGFINGLLLMSPKTGSAYAGTSRMALAWDIIRPDHSIALALFPTLASRYMWASGWNVHMAWQIDSISGLHQIYFTRFDNLPMLLPPEQPLNVSKGLAACDNINPSLSLGGTFEFSGWLEPWPLSSYKIGYDSFYHDELAWEAESAFIPPSLGNYEPVLRARHEGFSPALYPGLWGAYSIFTTGGWNHYPEPSIEDRRWDYKFASPADTSHDWIRLMYQNGTQLCSECWTPNWYRFILNESGNEPSIPESTGDFGPWPDSGAVERSICWTGTGTNPYVRITNGYMPRIKRFKSFPNAIISAGNLGCDTLVFLGYGTPVIVPPLSGAPVPLNWNPASPSLGGPSPAWHNPEDIPNVMTSSTFTVQACDSIIIPRSILVTTGLTTVQDSLRSSDDYVMFRLLLRNAIDSSYFGAVDSMIVTKSSIYWPGVTSGIEADTARYMVSCGASTDSVFLSMDAERGDTTNSIERYYISVMDTDNTAQPAEKKSNHPLDQNVDNNTLDVSVHPNPVHGTVKICVADLAQGIPATVDVVNEMGVQVAKLYDATPDAELGLCLQLDCTNLPSGTYYADLQTQGMHKAVQFSVQH